MGFVIATVACGGRSDIDGYSSGVVEAGPAVADATSDVVVDSNPPVTDLSITPSSLDFGAVLCGSSAAPQFIEIANKGTVAFSFTATLSLASSPFTIAPASGLVGPGKTVSIVVTPKPVSTDADTTPNVLGDMLDIATTLPNDDVHVIALMQTAKGAVLVWPSTLSFGNRVVGDIATMPLAITNQGNADATLSLSVAEPFDVSTTVTIPAGTTKNVDTDYTPDASRLGFATSATLTIDSSDVLCASLPAGITLTGSAYDVATALGANDFDSCALGQSGNLYCWGQGPVGDGTTAIRTTPTLTQALGVTSIAGNGNTLCAVESGKVQCWGDGFVGQLGNGTKNSSPSPVTVSGLSDVSFVTSGSAAFSFCAIHKTGLASCWGGNANGQCGTGTEANSITTPTSGFTNVSNAVAASISQGVGCVLRSDESVACAGMNSAGQLGNGGSPTSSDLPVAVSEIKTAVALSGTCAALADETVQCWGSGYNGELGDGQSGFNTIAFAPVAVSNLTDAVAVTAGLSFNCALEASGGVVCWGENTYGMLGNGTTTSSSVPVVVTGITSATAISAAYEHACAILSGGSLVCWGHGTSAELGNGQQASSSVPVNVTGFGP